MPKIPFRQDAVGRRVQKEFLNIRRQQQQVHDLRQPGPGDEAQPRQVCVIADFAAVDHVLKLDGQRHQTRDPGNAWGGFLLGSLSSPASAPAIPPLDGDLYVYGHRFLTSCREP
jgi:hypothetical protein